MYRRSIGWCFRNWLPGNGYGSIVGCVDRLILWYSKDSQDKNLVLNSVLNFEDFVNNVAARKNKVNEATRNLVGPPGLEPGTKGL